MPKCNFDKVAKATLLKSHFGTGVLLYIRSLFSEHLFLGTPLGDCFCSFQILILFINLLLGPRGVLITGQWWGQGKHFEYFSLGKTWYCEKKCWYCENLIKQAKLSDPEIKSFTIFLILNDNCKTLQIEDLIDTSLCWPFRYLSADQWKGPSSVEAYISALEKGCRCVERE